MKTTFRSIQLSLMFLAPALQAQTLPNTDIYLIDLKKNGDKYEFGKPENITHREGYDNQPSFFPDGRSLYFVSIKESKNADVYKYDLITKQTVQITNTPEDEYSPTAMLDARHFSTVRVEKDSTQRLWMFPLEGGRPELVFKDIRRIGYHCWIKKSLAALWILGDSLKIGDTKTGHATFADTGIGRCVQRIPGEMTFTFVKKNSQTDWVIMAYDMGSGRMIKLCNTLPGSEDYVWTPDGSILMANSGKLWKISPKKDTKWEMIADFKGTELENFYRIAISPGGDKLALVSYKGKKP